MARVHLGLIVLGPTERVGSRRAGLHQVAPAEHVLVVLAHRPPDACWPEVALRLGNSFSDFGYHEPGVILVGICGVGCHDRRSGMGVRGGDQHPPRWDSGRLAGQFLGLVGLLARDQQAVHDGDRDLSVPVVQHQAANVQRVRYLRGELRQDPAADRHRQLGRRDVDGRRAGAQLLLEVLVEELNDLRPQVLLFGLQGENCAERLR